MTSHSELEISGNLFTHSFAELLAELAEARVNGSLRVENKKLKAIVYFKEGRVVFAASNSRSVRLFQLMLNDHRLSKEEIVRIPDFANDIEFAGQLEARGILSRDQRAQLFTEQIKQIIIDVLAWTDGEWNLSSLRRVRDGLEFDVDTRTILLDHARSLSHDIVTGRFRSLDEQFHRSQDLATNLGLNPDEAFVYSRIGQTPLTIQDLMSVAAMTEAKALHALYTLWLAGLLIREGWQPALSPHMIATMRGAKLALRQEARPRVAPHPIPEAAAKAPVAAEPPKEVETAPDLEEYLVRVETADTYYDILGIDPKADLPTIKRAYFSLARAFHPDRFHSEGPDLVHRVQNAFTEMMQAHETLKSNETRDLYDYRMRKELAARQKFEADGNTGKFSMQPQQATENFEQGFTLLMDGEAAAAIPFLARAVHFAPNAARYHAYYGKALSLDPSQRHKAEAEMQAAVKLDPNNPAYRIILAEFFMEIDLLKRAEGELKRLLAMFPSNREALDLLASLQKPAR